MSLTDLIGGSGKCQYCGEDYHALPFKIGDNEGVSGTLSTNMLGGNAKVKLKKHKMYAGNNSLDAHHIIVEKSMQGEPWATYVNLCGYDINHKNNGVFLTSRSDVACLLATPLHTTSHSSGKNELGVNYSTLMTKKVDDIGRKIGQGQYCKNFDNIRTELDNLSKDTLVKISNFEYELFTGGRNYKRGNIGCGCGNRSNHKIMNTEESPEIIIRNEFDLHGKENKKLKDELTQMYLDDYSKQYNPTVNDPLVIGQ